MLIREVRRLDKTMIESIKDYFMQCPFLKDLKQINVDFLPEDPTTYSLEQVPATTVIERYLDGTTIRQFLFVFASRMYYSDELINNISNSGFFENLQNWLEQNTQDEILPELSEGLTPLEIEAQSSGYLFDISGDLSNARYQIQCRLLYEKEG